MRCSSTCHLSRISKVLCIIPIPCRNEGSACRGAGRRCPVLPPGDDVCRGLSKRVSPLKRCAVTRRQEIVATANASAAPSRARISESSGKLLSARHGHRVRPSRFQGFKVTMADTAPAIPSHRPKNDLSREMTPLEIAHGLPPSTDHGPEMYPS